jgi:hypothetical protein
MVEVRFINDTTPVEVVAEQQETTINVNSQSDITNVDITSTFRHDNLTNRELPDQHPISSITGLEKALGSFVFEQEIASTEWVVEHNLNKHPSYTIVDTAGNVQCPDEVNYENANKIIIKFIGAFAGKAYLN